MNKRRRISVNHEVKKIISNDENENEMEYFILDKKSKMLKLEYPMFNIEKLRKDIKLDKPIQGNEINNSMKGDKRIKLRSSLIYKEYEEEYDVNFNRNYNKFNPMVEIGKIIEYNIDYYVPMRYKKQFINTVLKPLNESYENNEEVKFIKVVKKYNKLVEDKINKEEVINELSNVKEVSNKFIYDILQMVYVRVVISKGSILNHEYKSFSNYVYGELMPKTISKMLKECGMNENSRFVDLGSGIGNVVLQAYLEYGCQNSFGCEIMRTASELTNLQMIELIKRGKIFGIDINKDKIEFELNKSFIKNEIVKLKIKESDIVLINNYLFDYKMDKIIIEMIQDMKIGSKIISLKKIRKESYKINFESLENDDILNRLQVKEYKIDKGGVSWTYNNNVNYYISTVTDSIDESLFEGRIRRINI